MNTSTSEHWQEYLPEILHVARIGMWEVLVTSEATSVHLSQGICDLLGYGNKPMVSGWRPFVKRACRPDAQERLTQAFAKALASPGVDFDLELPVWNRRTRDWNWVFIFGKSCYLDDGVTLQLLGGMQDVHPRRIVQKRLEREQQEALQTVALQTAILEEQIRERTTLLHDVQARVKSILGTTILATPAETTPTQPDPDVAATAGVASTPAGSLPDLSPPHPGGDVSERVGVLFAERLHKAFDTITERMAWYKAVIDSIPFPISITDLDGRWLYLNEPGLSIAGFTDLAHTIGRPAALWSEQGEPVVVKGEKGVFTFHHIGENRFFQGQGGGLFDSAGNRIGYIETMQDVTGGYEADTRMRLMLDCMPAACSFWDKNGDIIDCNKGAVSLFNLPDKSAFIEHFNRLSPEYQPDGTLSRDVALMKIRSAFESGYERFEWLHKSYTGELIPTEVLLVRLTWRGEYVLLGYTVDLRELKAAQRKLDRERLLLKDILDSSPVCMMILVNGVARFVTPFTRGYLGMDIDNTLRTFLNDSAEADILEEELLSKRTLNWRPVSIRSASDGIRQMLANAFFTEYDGEEGVIFWLVDVTDLRQQEHQLLLARDKAEESTRAKSEFLANMSHEIRTPLNAILGIGHLLLRTDLTDKQRDYLRMIDRSGKSLLCILNDILDFSKIEAGKLEMEQVAFNPAETLREAAGIIEHEAAKKYLPVTVAVASDTPLNVQGDPLRLRQVLLNLAGNAVKFTARGQVGLGLTVREVTDKTVTLHFTVTDTGIGMTRAQIDRLFSPFTQADTSTTREYGGTGLGLAISKRLAEMMQGSIWCESAPGRGTCFHVTARFGIPSQVTKTPAAGFGGILALNSDSSEEASEIARAALLPVTGKHILLVEDNALNQMVGREMLEIAGMRVDTAVNGKEAVEKVLAGNYDLVLMDIQMPEMDGFAASRAIRKDSAFDTLPIVAMTALAMQGDKERSLDAGMDDHVTKPIDAAELYKALRRWLRP